MPNRKYQSIGDATPINVAKRRAEAVLLRQAGLSYAEIAEKLGYGHHSSIIYLVKTHEGELESHALYRAVFASVMKEDT